MGVMEGFVYRHLFKALDEYLWKEYGVLWELDFDPQEKKELIAEMIDELQEVMVNE